MLGIDAPCKARSDAEESTEAEVLLEVLNRTREARKPEDWLAAADLFVRREEAAREAVSSNEQCPNPAEDEESKRKKTGSVTVHIEEQESKEEEVERHKRGISVFTRALIVICDYFLFFTFLGLMIAIIVLAFKERLEAGLLVALLIPALVAYALSIWLYKQRWMRQCG